MKESGKSKEEGQKPKLKVFIMDDSEIFRTGLVHILEQEKEDFELSGCDGYVHSKISRHSLVKIIKNLGRDICIFDRTAINKILFLENERRIGNKAQFSPRERRIVEMLAGGKNSAAIGKELELSSGTVKNIITQMLNRYHFKNRAQLVNELSAQ